jgi:hypothetical protein
MREVLAGMGAGVVSAKTEPQGRRGTVLAMTPQDKPTPVTAKALAALAGRRRGLLGTALSPSERAQEAAMQEAQAEQAQRLQRRSRQHLTRNLTRALQHRTNAAMCASCPKVSRDGMTCTALNEPVAVILTVRATDQETVRGALLRPLLACPLGRHANGSGVLVRWKGLLWYGTPEPLRWIIDWRWITRFGQRPSASTLAGCGCCVALKLRERRGGLAGKVLGLLARVPGLRQALLPRAAAWWLMVKADIAARRAR